MKSFMKAGKRPATTKKHAPTEPSRRPAECPSDSSLARMRWEGEGGACQPVLRDASNRRQAGRSAPEGASNGRGGTGRAVARNADGDGARRDFELIVLPFSEYSAIYPERLASLRERLWADPSPHAAKYVIVDATRVARPGGMLLGLLHAAAGEMFRRGRSLVLAGNLNGLAAVARLNRLCHVAATRGEAIAWCRAKQGRPAKRG